MNGQTLLTLAPFGLMMIIALVSWLTGQRLRTRLLGLIASGLTLVALAIVWWLAQGDLPLDVGQRAWLSSYGVGPNPLMRSLLTLHLDGLSLLFAAITLLLASIGFAHLALALGRGLVGYGRLWSGIAIMVFGSLLGILAGDLLLLAFGWGLALLGSTLARQVVGSDDQRTPSALGMSGLSGFAILVAVLSQSVRPEDVLDGSFVMADIGVGQYLRTWLPLAVGVGIALGFPPFGRVLSDDEDTTPALHGLIISAGVPVLAVYTFLRFFGLNLGTWPEAWFAALSYVGALASIVGAAYALRATRFGPLVGWQAVAQWGNVAMALGRYEPNLPLGGEHNTAVVMATLTITVTTLVATMLGAMALGTLERRSGSDLIAKQPALGAPLRAAGLAYALATAAAVGLPALPSFCARRWLMDYTGAGGWSMGVFFVSSGLLLLSFIGSNALFWRVDPQRPVTPVDAGRANDGLLLGLSLPLIGLSLAPEVLVWLLQPALRTLQAVPSPMDDLGSMSWGLRGSLVLGFMLLLFGCFRSQRQAIMPWNGGEQPDRDDGTAHLPAASSRMLSGLAVLGNPRPALRQSHGILQGLSSRIAWVLQFFSGRYYLTGILIAALTIVLLLMQ
ncbi:MAG TPA: hypothetical protein DEF47_22185 [Herpetosiphon sp.]|uniref:Formate hydrogenlyase subunit 3/Multisubunit Na+/H+ antiporter MnhD subunit-like n=1 Tax=Herpetosiphon aurantiacus (strain ATCC 23779 / DSM 785 / 114-95) TaxID=316274 RepID=A9B5P9_HERA2|nr:hypothetical protein [Herpetosiphon sp.]ABX04282.1 Formate hydrogenlyase subunit 3/Multisubunit Na+/H+ antiporter MnhD subunit-like [Herpetosiphon aurantiacus DSM 785]HBW52599.1 hypothetical protein [Herpetosiphon sp.]